MTPLRAQADAYRDVPTSSQQDETRQHNERLPRRGHRSNPGHSDQIKHLETPRNYEGATGR